MNEDLSEEKFKENSELEIIERKFHELSILFKEMCNQIIEGKNLNLEKNKDYQDDEKTDNET